MHAHVTVFVFVLAQLLMANQSGACGYFVLLGWENLV